MSGHDLFVANVGVPSLIAARSPSSTPRRGRWWGCSSGVGPLRCSCPRRVLSVGGAAHCVRADHRTVSVREVILPRCSRSELHAKDLALDRREV
jgi:hypothetical protein